MRKIQLIVSLTLMFIVSGQLDAQDRQVFFDFHCHSSFKPFHSRAFGDYNLWSESIHNCALDSKNQLSIIKNFKNLPKASQANLNLLSRGNVGYSVQVINPLDTRYLTAKLLKKGDNSNALTCLLGISADKEFFQGENRDYFSEVTQNIMFITNSQKSSKVSGREISYDIIQKPEFFKGDIPREKLGLVFAIEGGHSLGTSYYINSGETDSKFYERIVLKNLEKLKGSIPLVDYTENFLDFPILYITLASQFDNGFCGYANSFEENQRGIYGNDNNPGSVTELGKKVIKLMLESEKGRRILVDAKNMSVASREWYYQLLDRWRLFGDVIPVVFSEVGISGKSWSSEDYKLEDNAAKNKNSILNHWTMNLAKEDIDAVFKSKGLIGVSLDIDVLAGQVFRDKLELAVEGSAQLYEESMNIFIANLITIIKVVNKKEAWDIVTIGSNFDGMMNPINICQNSEDFPRFADALFNFFESPKTIEGVISAEEIEKLKFDYSAEEIVEKVMLTNAKTFVANNIQYKAKSGMTTSNGGK